jgi:transcription elongation factor Elf1
VRVVGSPKILCPRCGAELHLRSVEKRGWRRTIVCGHCDTLTEWSIAADPT